MSRRIVLVDIGNGLTLGGVLPSVTLFAPYNARVMARGGSAPYTYTIVSGEVALTGAGIYLDPATGVFASASASIAGNFPITVLATDITGASVRRQFVISVIAEPLAVSGSPPDAQAGAAYTYQYPVAYGGVPPYVYALAAHPSWLSLDGGTRTVTGIPPDAPSANWTIQVTDAVGSIATLSSEMAIEPPAALAVGEPNIYWVVDETGLDWGQVSSNYMVGMRGDVGHDADDWAFTCAATRDPWTFYVGVAAVVNGHHPWDNGKMFSGITPGMGDLAVVYCAAYSGVGQAQSIKSTFESETNTVASQPVTIRYVGKNPVTVVLRHSNNTVAWYLGSTLIGSVALPAGQLWYPVLLASGTVISGDSLAHFTLNFGQSPITLPSGMTGVQAKW